MAKSGHCPRRLQGFSMLELLFVVIIALILIAIAVPSYQSFIESSRQATAVADIRGMELAIEKFTAVGNAFPDSLADIGELGTLDPWGHAYVYQPLLKPSDKGKARKDRNLVPLNTDYDLYSVGKDGRTKPPLAPKVSHDDVLRANNGRYVGLASDY